MNRDALILIVALALVGGVAGGAAVLGAGTLARWIARRLGIPASPRYPEAQPGNGEGGQLESVRRELLDLRTGLNRVLREVSDLSHTLRTDRLAAGASSAAAAPPAGGAATRRERIGSSQAMPERSAEPGASYSPPPPREPGGWSQGSGGPGAPYHAPSPPRDPWENQRPVEWMDRIDAGLSGAPAYETFDQPPAAGLGAPAAVPAEPVAPRAPAGPPPNAVSVEARDDRIVASSSYPPEAWLEPRGPAVAHLWLNPSVALNENALRRLSTFFQWQGERAGATYDTDTPAVLRWDEGQRVGTVTQRGTARPR
jgi:hypothetical protein